jgi:uncharacterized protein YegL
MNTDAANTEGAAAPRELPLPARPGGALQTRPLHFIWLVDCSGSMALDGKMQAVNTAIKEAIPIMKQVADENPNARIMIRALKFNDFAQWHMPEPTLVNDFRWLDIQAGGGTRMGAALATVAEQLKMPPMDSRALPPVLVMLSDGEPTDDYEQGLQSLFAEPWGRKAVRLAIAIGQNAKKEELQRFINHEGIEPLQANNPEALTRYIKFVSTEVVRSVSAPASQAGGENAAAMDNLPMPMVDATAPPTHDVW